MLDLLSPVADITRQLNPLHWFAIGYGVLLLIGIICGSAKKIVVFRNVGDLSLVFSITAIPFVAFLGVMFYPTLVDWFLWPSLILTGLAGIAVVIRTFQDNLNPLYSLIALLTKIPLGILFMFLLIEFVTPQGTRKQRAQNRRFGFIGLVLLTPLIYALVQDKNGFARLTRRV